MVSFELALSFYDTNGQTLKLESKKLQNLFPRVEQIN